MDTNRFWELLAKTKAGESTPEEQLELNQFFLEDPAYQELAGQLDTIWNSTLMDPAVIQPTQIDEAWQGIRKKMVTEKPIDIFPTAAVVIPGNKNRLFYRVTAAAAIAGIMLLAGWLLTSRTHSGTTSKQNIVSTKNGSKSKIELPDGTQVWLNAGSQLTYDENYGKQSRELQLTGEAFFDVVHNAAMPFVIHTQHMNVKVLGTAFNVRAYPGDLTSEAALIRGSIEVSFPDRPSEKLILKPQQKLTIVNKEPLLPEDAGITKTTVLPNSQVSIPVISISGLTYDQADSAVIETSWMANRLIFRKKDFSELAKEMERRFNISIQLQDSGLAEKKFTGTFYNENMKEVLGALQLSYPFHYKFGKGEDTVFIYNK